MAAADKSIVITGLGVVSPIGIGTEAFWSSLCAGRSGVGPLTLIDNQSPVRFGAEIADFDPKQYVTPRKSLKVMSRVIQLAFVAAQKACQQAQLQPGAADPERFGVVFGSDIIVAVPDELTAAYQACMVDGRFDFRSWGEQALSEINPLWLLLHLPNMPACHIGIAHDARGPNNSITLSEVSSLLAIAEAARVIQRGQADVMIAGGTGSYISPAAWLRACTEGLSARNDEPARASRPFDAHRDGEVRGEGAAAFILESSAGAAARGAPVLARLLSAASGFRPNVNGASECAAVRHCVRSALTESGLEANQIGHVNAHGISNIAGDRREAQAIRAELGSVPVTAPKSYFGNLGAGGGAVELAVSVLALQHGQVPPTLNYEVPDPACPVEVIRGEPLVGAAPTALVLNQTPVGQSAAVIIAGPGE